MTAGGTWYGLRRDPTIGFASGVRGLAQVGLLVGILMLALQGAPVVAPPPDAPGTVARTATRLPLIMTLRTRLSLHPARHGRVPCGRCGRTHISAQ
jgi:hypothetical protein